MIFRIIAILLFLSNFNLMYGAGCATGAQFSITNRDCNTVPANPLELCVSGNGLTDCPGQATYTWDFGDGTTLVGRDVCHIYASPGVYDVTLSLNVDAPWFSCGLLHFNMDKTCPTTIQVYISGSSDPFSYSIDTSYNCPENSANLTINIEDTINGKWLWNPTQNEINNLYVVTDFGIFPQNFNSDPRTITTSSDTNILYVRYLDCEFWDTIILDFISSNSLITSDYNGRDISCYRAEDGEVTVNAQGGGMPYTYDLNGQIISPSNNNSEVYTLLDTGTYFISVTDNKGCMTFDTVNLTEPSPIAMEYRVDEDTCGNSDGLIQLYNITGGTPSYLITWNTGDGDSLNDNLATGQYIFVLQDLNGCEYTDTFNLLNRDNPIAQFSTFNVCQYTPAEFTNSSFIPGDTTNQFGMTYLWNFDDGNSSITENPLNLFNSHGTYQVQLIATTEYGCSDTIVNPIQIYAVPNASIDIIEACEFDTTYLNDASTIAEGTVVQWIWREGNDEFSQQNIKIVKDIENTYPIELVAVSDQGCRDSILSSFFVHHLPTASFTSSSNEIDLIHNKVEFTNQSLRADNYYWIFDTAGTSSLIDPEFFFPNGECKLFHDTLIAETNFGCRDSAYNEIYMKDILFSYIPNSFTPDNDGINDIFNPVGDRIDIEGYSLKIFDRWGELIFESNDPSKGWDGTIKNIPAQQDVYIWTIKLKAICLTEKEQKKGHVTLLR